MNLPQCHIIHHKLYVDYLQIELGLHEQQQTQKRPNLWKCKFKITNIFKMLLGNKLNICT